MRDQDEYSMLTQVIEHCLSDDYSRLNCLAETDFVGKQITLGVIGQDASHNVYLMRFQLDR